MAKNKKRKGSKKYKSSTNSNSSGHSYQPGVDRSSKSKFHGKPNGYNRVNAHAKRGHLGK